MKGQVAIIGLIPTLAGAGMLYSNIDHQPHGVQGTATLRARGTECSVEYQRVSKNKRTFETMDRKAAAAFQQRVGASKVKLLGMDFAQVLYAGPDGAPHEAKVAASFAPADAKIGEGFPVIFDPAPPEDVATPLGREKLGIDIAILLAGLAMAALGLGFSPARLPVGRLVGARAERDEAEPDWMKAADVAVSRAHLRQAPLIAGAPERDAAARIWDARRRRVGPAFAMRAPQ